MLSALRLGVMALLMALLPAMAAAAWHDPASAFRRSLHIGVDEAKITGEELAVVRIMGNGLQHPDGQDIHVTTAVGKPVPYQVIWTGGSDEIDIAFNPVKSGSDYFVYFGSGNPAINPPAASLNHGGLLMELKPYANEAISSGAEVKSAFERQKKIINRRIITRAHLGNNLIANSGPTLTSVSGHLFVPLEGVYVFAVAAQDRGALYIDKKLEVFSRTFVSDARFQERVKLTRGWHEFALFHADAGGEYSFTVAWKRPDMDKFDTIGREFFGPLLQCDAGALEEQGKPLTADMVATYLGESFFAGNYSHRYRFDAASALRNAERTQVNWEFGDGQTASGRQVEHVFLSAGTYAVKVTFKLGANSDTQSFRLKVDRDFGRVNDPPTDELGLHAKMVAGYDVDKLAPDTLAWAVLMQTRTGGFDQALRSAKALAKVAVHPNRGAAQRALQELHDELINRKQPAKLGEVFAAVPPGSDLQPWAAIEYANLLMYALGDFRAADDAIRPLASRDDASRRTQGQALLLVGKIDEARKLLEALPVGASLQKVSALSGAMARTTEFYVREKDALGGEEAWEKWMTTFPADFLEGNAALMKVELIEIRGQADVAAKVAEAYANGNPQSAYAPRLLDRASTLLAKSDKAKSDALRALLKERYPEDPLSQK